MMIDSPTHMMVFGRAVVPKLLETYAHKKARNFQCIPVPRCLALPNQQNNQKPTLIQREHFCYILVGSSLVAKLQGTQNKAKTLFLYV